MCSDISLTPIPCVLKSVDGLALTCAHFFGKWEEWLFLDERNHRIKRSDCERAVTREKQWNMEIRFTHLLLFWAQVKLKKFEFYMRSLRSFYLRSLNKRSDRSQIAEWAQLRVNVVTATHSVVRHEHSSEWETYACLACKKCKKNNLKQITVRFCSFHLTFIGHAPPICDFYWSSLLCSMRCNSICSHSFLAVKRCMNSQFWREIATCSIRKSWNLQMVPMWYWCQLLKFCSVSSAERQILMKVTSEK